MYQSTVNISVEMGAANETKKEYFSVGYQKLMLLLNLELKISVHLHFYLH